MPRHRRDLARRPGRQRPFREPKPVILIVCEGEKTEPQYLKGFVNAWRNPRVQIKIAPERGVPKTLVELAKQYKNDALANAARHDDNYAYDAVWCVFDVDDHAGVSNAVEMARDNGIHVAISNPCFELWLLLHFHDSPRMQHREKFRQLLKKSVPQYDKHVDYGQYEKGYTDAVQRARRLDEIASGDWQVNPTTGVYKLTESIRDE